MLGAAATLRCGIFQRRSMAMMSVQLTKSERRDQRRRAKRAKTVKHNYVRWKQIQTINEDRVV